MTRYTKLPPKTIVYLCFFVILIVSLSACKIAPASVAPATEESGIKPDIRLGTIDFSPEWQPFANEKIQGLFYTTIKIANPKLEIWAIKADLANPALQVFVNRGAEGKVLSTKVSSFVETHHLLAGINTVPFDRISAKEGEARTCVGIVVSDGIITSLPAPGYDALVFYKNRGEINAGNGQNFAGLKAEIVSQREITDLSSIEHAVGGFNIILESGELPERLLMKNAAPRHPRSAAGLSDNGQTLYLLAIDGRRTGSSGATEAETGLILKKLGAEYGLNFDGGGSTALALRLDNSRGYCRVKTINTPIHGGIPGRERAVAACLGIGAVESKQNNR